jgi:hypothetical protein
MLVVPQYEKKESQLATLGCKLHGMKKKIFSLFEDYLGAFSAPQLDINVSNRCFCISRLRIYSTMLAK